MEILEKLGITPEEFLEGFQSYLKSLPGNDEDDMVTVLPSGRTVTRNHKGLVVDNPKTGSHFKNYLDILLSRWRDDRLGILLEYI